MRLLGDFLRQFFASTAGVVTLGVQLTPIVRLDLNQLPLRLADSRPGRLDHELLRLEFLLFLQPLALFVAAHQRPDNAILRQFLVSLDRQEGCVGGEAFQSLR